MAIFDPWEPQPGAEAPPDVQMPFLDDPRLRGALLQAGLNLMQPPSFGDNAASLIGRAVGAGGESVQRQEAQDLKQQEADSKAQLREAQATAAGSKAEAQASKLDTASQRLALERFKTDEITRRQLLGNQVRLHLAYAKQQNDFNKDVLKKPGDVFPSYDEWLAKNPQLAAQFPTTRTESQTMGGEEGDLEDAPRNPAERTPGKVYKTPLAGNQKWTGSGWVKP